MSHEVESMAWAHEVPWHGLGVRVDANISPEDMLVKAGLNWEVEKRPIWTSMMSNEDMGAAREADDGFMPIMQQVRGKMALTRKTDNKVFGVVGENWKPVQNSDVLEFFRHFCDEGGATLETAGALKGGQIVWGLANLGTGFVLPGGDAVKGYLLLASKHEAGFATIGRITPVRVVCANTFALAGGFRGEAQVRVPHTMQFDPKQASDAIGIARAGMSEFEKNARTLMKLNISRTDAIRILAPVFQPQDDVKDVLKDFDANASRTVKAIMEAALTGAGQDQTIQGTGWGLLNGATFWANHRAKGTRDSRMASTLTGQNNVNLNKVFGTLMDMAD